MSDDFTFDWVVLAPIADVEASVEQACVARGLDGTWYSSAPDGFPVKGRRITTAGKTLAVLTLQGYQPDQTHLRLQPAARALDQAQDVAALAETLYSAFGAAGWTPTGALFTPAPRFVRPHGFRPRPGVAAEPE
jgi:hypothetical protein